MAEKIEVEHKKENDLTTVSLPVKLLEKVDQALDKCGYLNRSDFVRDAVRKALEKIDA